MPFEERCTAAEPFHTASVGRNSAIIPHRGITIWPISVCRVELITVMSYSRRGKQPAVVDPLVSSEQLDVAQSVDWCRILPRSSVVAFLCPICQYPPDTHHDAGAAAVDAINRLSDRETHSHPILAQRPDLS